MSQSTLEVTSKTKKIPSIALVDTSFLTAWSNDHGYEIFSEDNYKLWQKKMNFIFSGESKNILNAIDYANSKQFLLQGIKRIRAFKSLFFFFKAPSSETAIIQELHTIVGHEICS